jgi:hypothetical protein
MYVVCRRGNVLCTLFIGGVMSYVRCLLVYSGVQHILCCAFLRIVYPMLPVSLDYPYLIAPSAFSTVYLR